MKRKDSDVFLTLIDVKGFFHPISMLIYIKIQLICDEVFVDVGDIVHGFPSDDFTGNFFYIKKPFVRVESSF